MTISLTPPGDAVPVEEVVDPQVPERAKRRTYTAKYKADIVAEYDRLDRDGRGALLRREGLYSSHISEWRKQAAEGAMQALGKARGRPRLDPVERESVRLRAEVAMLQAEVQTSRRVIEVRGVSGKVDRAGFYVRHLGGWFIMSSVEG